MKTDLFTSIAAAVAGVLIAFFVTNLFIGPIEDVTYTTVDAKVNASLATPDPEVFNYRALNPTVEVYVGECDEYNEYGECVEVDASVEETVDVEEVEVEEDQQSAPEPTTQETN